jgi:hypothetical protein
MQDLPGPPLDNDAYDDPALGPVDGATNGGLSLAEARLNDALYGLHGPAGHPPAHVDVHERNSSCVGGRALMGRPPTRAVRCAAG